MLEDGTILGSREFRRYYKQNKSFALLEKMSRSGGMVRFQDNSVYFPLKYS